MKRINTYQIGDQVQTDDGRVGTVIDTRKLTSSTEFSNYECVMVEFPNGLMMLGSSENFRRRPN